MAGVSSSPPRSSWIAQAVEDAAMVARVVTQLQRTVSSNNWVESRPKAPTDTPQGTAIADSRGLVLLHVFRIIRVLVVAVSQACKTTWVPPVLCRSAWMQTPGTATGVAS